MAGLMLRSVVLVASLILPPRVVTSFVLPTLALVALVVLGSCKLKVPDNAAGSDESLIPCETAETCPLPDKPCLAAHCMQGSCVFTPAPPQSQLPSDEQLKGDCKQLYCDGDGDVISYPARFDLPADDGNPCTEAACDLQSPRQLAKPAGTRCGDDEICTGTGICGVCLPHAQRCDGHSITTCSDRGQWSAALRCNTNKPVCTAAKPKGEHDRAQCIGVAEVALGAAHGCALFDDGSARCWGDRRRGQTGGGGLSNASAPPWGTSFLLLSFGEQHACAVRRDGTAWCWGANDYGQLGDASFVSTNAPVKVHGLRGVTAVAVGQQHSCAIAEGKAHCWGRRDHGQLGDGKRSAEVQPAQAGAQATGAFEPAPQPLNGLRGATKLALSGTVSCVTTSSGDRRCWGLRSFDLPEPIETPEPNDGDAPTEPTNTPDPVAEREKLAATTAVAVVGVPSVATALSCGANHCCAVDQAATLHCWGANDRMQLGTTDDKTRLKATKVAGVAGVAQIAIGKAFGCARVSSGQVYCWGDNSQGQLGTGSEQPRAALAPLAALDRATWIGAGDDFACARLTDGPLHCWGGHARGQLGSGDEPRTGLSRHPVAVTW